MATIVRDGRELGHRPVGRRPARCTSPRPRARSGDRRSRPVGRCGGGARGLAAGVGVAVAGALALGLAPGSDGTAPAPERGAGRPAAEAWAGTGADPEPGGTYRAIERALAGSGDLHGLAGGLEGAAAAPDGTGP